MESVLASIKKLLGIAEEYTQFDTDIIMHINDALMTLNQLGVGPQKAASISSADDTWDETLGDLSNLEAAKTYIYRKVRLVFDPPTSSAVIDALNRQIAESEWRLTVQAESEVRRDDLWDMLTK